MLNRHASRGQTLVETALFLPIVLLSLTAVIYFCNVGIQDERLQLTARYGALNLFYNGTQSAYNAENIYTATVVGNVCPKPPTTLLSNGAPLPAGNESAAFWNPSSASSTCDPLTKDLGGASFLMARYLTAGNVSVTTHPNPAFAPTTYLALIGAGGNPAITASLAFVHAAWPGAILACSAKTQQAVEDLLTATETVTLPSGWNPGSCNIQK